MTEGSYISGGGHLALIAGLFLGGWLGSDPPPPQDVADVSIITEREYAALVLPDESPDTVIDIPVPVVPDVEDAPAPTPRPEDPPVASDPPATEAPEDPDVLPDVPLTSDPQDPELIEDLPELVMPETPQPEVTTLAPPDETPAPQEAPRVAPIPVPETPLNPDIAETATPRVSPDAETPEVAEDQPEAAPDAATTEIVTEAETPASAPVATLRPVARPVRRDPATEPAPDTSIDDVVAAVAADTVSDPARPVAATGPPLTGSEKEGLRVAVQQCWNVGSLSSEALTVTVVVSVSMQRDGRPNGASIRMLDFSDGPDSAARLAYEAARRAIIRCGVNGYDLPVEKYEQWREIEMTFNPERMRIK